MSLPKWLTIERVLIVALVLALLFRIAYPSCPQLVPELVKNPYDYRYMGPLGVIVINATWIGQPLANVTARLYTSNLTLVSERVTNARGLAVFDIPTTGTFFIRLEYYAYFKQGGVEIVHRWIIIQGDPSSLDTFTLNWSTAPAIWPDEPPKL